MRVGGRDANAGAGGDPLSSAGGRAEVDTGGGGNGGVLGSKGEVDGADGEKVALNGTA